MSINSFPTSISIVVGRQHTLSLCQRIQNYEREMVARSTPKVLASHEASGRLHSPEILNEPFTIEGVDPDISAKILNQFEAEGIGADYGADALESLLISKFQQIRS